MDLLEELATQFKDTLLEDDKYSALVFFEDFCEMTESEMGCTRHEYQRFYLGGMIMFKYEINYDGTVFCGEEWETYEEAMEEANMFIESKIADWEADGVEYDRELFYIEIVEE